MKEFFYKIKSGEWASRKRRRRKRRFDRKSNGTRQKNKCGDSKVESNDSPDILDRRETLGLPGLPSGSGVLSSAPFIA